MPLFQFIGEGHTLVQTKKGIRDKVKVVNGEIVEIEEGLHTAGRLMLAGFQEIVDAAEEAVEVVTDGVKDIAETVTDSDIDGDGKVADEVPAEVPAETPAVEVTTEIVDDGSADITLEVTTDEPKVDGSEGTDIGAESNAAAEGAEGTLAPETPAEEAPKVEEAPAKAPAKITPTKKK